jgi:hypothetical protein
VTARASTFEHLCSTCRYLVLRGEAAASPRCSSCGRVTCAECEFAGLCPSCVEELWTPPDALDVDERVPVVVGGSSLPGRRPVRFVTQPLPGATDDAA